MKRGRKPKTQAEERSMVRVIEYRSEAGPAPVLEIAVYRDLGGSHWQHSI